MNASKAVGSCCAAQGAMCRNGCAKAKATGDKPRTECATEKEGHEACVSPASVTWQEKCPVMGGAINKKLYVDHGGKRIYVCCKGCIAPVQKDPEKYIKALEADGVRLETVKPKTS